MEVLKYIINEIQRSKEKRKTSNRIKSLAKFFDSPTGRRYLEDVSKEWNIQKPIEERKIIAIDNDNQEVRLVMTIENNKFIDIVHDRKPKTLKYRITRQTDAMDAGDLLVEVNDKIAVQTFGILFPQTSGVKGILDKISDARYIPTIKDYPDFQPWRELALNELLEE